ncbi:MAG: hypothetical protein RIT32_993, partial [Actinomycetota bacterium]
MAAIDTGDTAWMMVSAALVLLMIPGLSLFYGGMVRSKSVLNMIMMSFSALGLVAVLWILYGFSITFGNSIGDAGFVGDVTQFLGLSSLMNTEAVIGTIPAPVFIAFQGMFAAI